MKIDKKGKMMVIAVLAVVLIIVLGVIVYTAGKERKERLGQAQDTTTTTIKEPQKSVTDPVTGVTQTELTDEDLLNKAIENKNIRFCTVINDQSIKIRCLEEFNVDKLQTT